MLYLIATPIGNLQDISFRALDQLKSCDYILCEDTRHTENLLRHYNIQNRTKSYHKFNEAKTEDGIIADLKLGKVISLVSDAGTPGISDPGARLVARAIQEGINVFSVPGPCALIAALTCSGLDTSRFQFVGFLPKKETEIKKALVDILQYAGTSICYESPNRLIKIIEDIAEIDANRLLVAAKEITKKFETYYRGTAEELLVKLKQAPLKGEFVLLIAANSALDKNDWSSLTPEEHVNLLQETYRLSRQEAIKMAAGLRGVSKREIYRQTQI